MEYHIKTYTSGEEVPEMTSRNFFHSATLFNVMKETSGESACMAVAFTSDGNVAGHLMAMIYNRRSWLPPYIYSECRIYGEGDYEQEYQNEKEQIFGLMLHHLTRKLRRYPCLYIEVSGLPKKMFAYRFFRQCSYFPMQWQEVHNSLHNKSPKDRITSKRIQRIQRAKENGVTTREASSKEEIDRFYDILKAHYRMNLRHHLPSRKQIERMSELAAVKIFVTVYKEKVIGGSICVYNEGNAYLWFQASKRKTYPFLHPSMVTVWNAIDYAYKHNYAHIIFMDVGLPFKRSVYRDFILSFGGKPVGTYRWFRISIRLFNKILAWMYKE